MLPGKKKRILAYFNKRFGNNPLEFPDVIRCRDRLPQIRIFHDTFFAAEDGDEYAVDDVTWSDLEMDEVFLRINQTGSYIGEQVLYQTLRSGNDSLFRENRQMTDALAEKEKARQDLALRLYPIGKRKESYYLPEFFANAGLLRPGHSWVFHILQACLVITLVLAACFRTMPFYAALALNVIVNFIIYMQMKMKYDVLLSSFSGIGQVLELYEWSLQQDEIPLPADSCMEEHAGKLKKIRKKIGILIYTVLSFRNSLTHWCKPVLTEGGDLTAQGLYHPLLKEPVSNDFTLRDRAILTGANASGKSTFMKSLAVNVILSQTIDTACCSALSIPLLKVMTSMAIRDDVVSGESYYVREVRYLKRMLDEISRGTMTLCVIDEILKGTNQAERLAASEAVLKYMAQFQGYCIIATHDMELVEKLQQLYKRYYFESHIIENNVSFDYKIHPGEGGESNALALLRAFGFPEEIVRDANALIASAADASCISV